MTADDCCCCCGVLGGVERLVLLVAGGCCDGFDVGAVLIAADDLVDKARDGEAAEAEEEVVAWGG